MYVLATGRQRRAIPKNLPPRSTAHGYYDLQDWDGTLERIHHKRYVKCRKAIGREASPTVAVMKVMKQIGVVSAMRCYGYGGYLAATTAWRKFVK